MVLNKRSNSGVEVEEEGHGGGRGYTEDGTVDLRGNPVLRSKRGGWRACSFVVGNPNIYFFQPFWIAFL